jgi:hypothetical protein
MTTVSTPLALGASSSGVLSWSFAPSLAATLSRAAVFAGRAAAFTASDAAIGCGAERCWPQSNGKACADAPRPTRPTSKATLAVMARSIARWEE